ncbi:RepB family plasmid replication initiator protein [Ectothiorhodospiraceae bacterium BW-2]|nr:RepB family plasmid replication initiator protein [Ectothiorhodospiraceae bacterium BW-2]
MSLPYISDAVISNALVTASYKMSVPEKRIIALAISQIGMDQDVTDEDVYRVSNFQYSKMSGVSRSMAWLEIKEATTRLLDRKVSIERGKDTMVFVFVQQAIFEENSSISIRFSKPILPFISQLKKNFTKLDVRELVSFSGFYAMRLYEMIMQYKNIGKCNITVLQFRKSLGIDEGKYVNGKDFRRYIIERPLNEINNKTKYNISYKPIKLGRKINSYEFVIREKEIVDNGDFLGVQVDKNSRKPSFPPLRWLEAHSELAPPGKTYSEIKSNPNKKIIDAWERENDWLRWVRVK